jgi:peroxiredoxin
VDVGERPAIVKEFAQERNLTTPILLDGDGSVAGRFRVRNIPASFLIDREGVIRTRHVGPLADPVLSGHLKPFL